jgi:hypothetical protein
MASDPSPENRTTQKNREDKNAFVFLKPKKEEIRTAGTTRGCRQNPSKFYQNIHHATKSHSITNKFHRREKRRTKRNTH